MKAMNFKETIMKAKPKIGSMDDILDELYGKPERDKFDEEAYAFYIEETD